MKQEEQPTLIYDAECRLCVSSKRWMERWDIKQRIRFIPFQNDEARRWVSDIAPTGCLDAMRFMDHRGAVSSGVDAFRGMLPYLPMGRVIALFFRLPGAYRLVVLLYRMIARNRYRWFGAAAKK